MKQEIKFYGLSYINVEKQTMQNKNSPGVVLTNYQRFFFSFRGIYMTQKSHAVQSFGQRDE